MNTEQPATERLSIMVGALAEPMGKQLREQGFKVTAARANAFQGVAGAITLLKIHDYMTEKAADAARKKLWKRIKQAVRA